MREQWRDVPGYEGLYCVSNQGRVYSVKRQKVLGVPGGRCRPVVCLETGEEFPSAKAAADGLRVSHKGVIRICNGQQKATRKHKLHFKYKDETKEEI